MPKEVPKILLIREAVEASIKKPITVAISAMREDELIDFILNWRCTEDEAVEAYERLRQMQSERYPPIEHLI